MDQDLPAKLEVKQPVISSSFRSRAVPMFSVWLRDLIISLSISAFIIIFLYQPVKVEGTSMMPSLDDQERIFVNKFVYRMEPIRRGDIVVFHYPRDPSKSFIKRVIGLAGDHIQRLCAISKATYYRYLAEYRRGGLAQLKEVPGSARESVLQEYRGTLEAYFLAHPPATVAEAQAKLAELTGITRGPTQVRQFLHALGMKPRKVGTIPAKADVEQKVKQLTDTLAEETRRRKDAEQQARELGTTSLELFESLQYYLAPTVKAWLDTLDADG